MLIFITLLFFIAALLFFGGGIRLIIAPVEDLETISKGDAIEIKNHLKVCHRLWNDPQETTSRSL